jgi:bifunctional UDP-N-acetylglucosamine pyrophosphorylase/glucosamine-1-phosphate N-acetyltransferase
MKALIMAAGGGVRLKPFTQRTPKVLLPIAGKAIIHHLIEEAAKAGITEAVLVIRSKKEKVIEYFEKNKCSIPVSFIEQSDENGTGAAILSCESVMKDRFLVLAGDMVTDSSVIKEIIDGHSGRITVGLRKVGNPAHYGVAEVANGKISSFEEKPRKPQSDLANMSIYVMEPTVFSEIRSIPKSERGEYEIVSLFMGANAVVTSGYWKDVGYPWDLADAAEHIIGSMQQKDGHIENSTINGKVVMEEGAKVINSFIEGSAYIGKNTVIGPNAYLRGINSIGENCHIGESTTLKNSVLFDNVNAKHLAYIGDSVIGNNVNFGSGTQLANFRFDERHVNVMTERGWVNTGSRKIGAFVGDGTKFGVLSSVMPGKIIGCNCWINSGVVVNKNVPPDTIVYVKNELGFAKQGE